MEILGIEPGASKHALSYLPHPLTSILFIYMLRYEIQTPTNSVSFLSSCVTVYASKSVMIRFWGFVWTTKQKLGRAGRSKTAQLCKQLEQGWQGPSELEFTWGKWMRSCWQMQELRTWKLRCWGTKSEDPARHAQEHGMRQNYLAEWWSLGRSFKVLVISERLTPGVSLQFRRTERETAMHPATQMSCRTEWWGGWRDDRIITQSLVCCSQLQRKHIWVYDLKQLFIEHF